MRRCKQIVTKYLRKLQPGYMYAFVLGSLVTHYVGFSRSARVPTWLQVLAYVALVAVILGAAWMLWQVRQFSRSLKEEERKLRRREI